MVRLDKRATSLRYVIEKDGPPEYAHIEVNATRSLATDGRVMVSVDHREPADLVGSYLLTPKEAAILDKAIPTTAKAKKEGLDYAEFSPEAKGELRLDKGDLNLAIAKGAKHEMCLDFELLTKIAKVLTAGHAGKERSHLIIKAYPYRGAFVYVIEAKGRPGARACLAGVKLDS